VDDVIDLVPSIGRILDNLEKIQGEKGIPKKEELINKNITNSSLSRTSTSSTLTTPEKKRYREAYSIFSDVFFDYQKKNKEDEKPTTLFSEVKRPIEKQTGEQHTEKTKSTGFLGMLIPILMGLGAVVASVISLVSGFFTSGVMSDAAKILGKIGIGAGLKILSKTILKGFAKPLLKKLPIIGGLISLFYAYKEFQAGRTVPGLLELASGLVNFIPGIGPVLSIGIDLLKGFLDAKGMFNEGGLLSNANAWGTVKGWMASAGKWIMDNALNMPILGTFKRLGMAWDAFGSGKWSEGFKQIGLGVISIAGGGEYIENGINWLVSFFDQKITGEQGVLKTSGIMDTINGWVSSAGKWINEHALYMPIIGGFKRFGMAWDAFEGGNLGEGFKQLGLGLMTFVGGGPIVSGMEMLYGWLLGKEEEPTNDFESKSGWMGRMKDWIKGKLKNLPDFLRKPLEWMGILDESGTEESMSESSNKKGVMEKLSDSIGAGIDNAVNIGKTAFDSVSSTIGSVYKNFTNFVSEGYDASKSMISSYMSKLKSNNESNLLKEDSVTKFVADSIKDNKELPEKLASNVDKDTVTSGINSIVRISKIQVELLSKIHVTGINSLQELKRINKSSSGGMSTMITPVPISSNQSSTITFDENRMGYGSSVYSLGG